MYLFELEDIGGVVWIKEKGYARGAIGHFTMRRTSHEPPTAKARPTHPRVATRRVEEDFLNPPDANAGRLRVRVWDEGSRRYIPLRFDLGMPNGTTYSAGFHGGTDSVGWGPPIRLRPGRYAAKFFEFPCDSLVFFFEPQLIRHIRIKRDSTTELSLTVNLLTAPAAKSFDNPAGGRCGDPVQ